MATSVMGPEAVFERLWFKRWFVGVLVKESTRGAEGSCPPLYYLGAQLAVRSTPWR